MNSNYAAGGEIEAWCTKCKLELGHTIVAMVDNVPKRVKCNTCNGQHNYRAQQAEKRVAKSKTSPRRARTKQATYEEYLSRLTDGTPGNAKKYMMNGSFEKDELIDHPQFGIGIVLSVIHVNKMEILFKDGPRLLGQNL